jgi:hypothetical protein
MGHWSAEWFLTPCVYPVTGSVASATTEGSLVQERVIWASVLWTCRGGHRCQHGEVSSYLLWMLEPARLHTHGTGRPTDYSRRLFCNLPLVHFQRMLPSRKAGLWLFERTSAAVKHCLWRMCSCIREMDHVAPLERLVGSLGRLRCCVGCSWLHLYYNSQHRLCHLPSLAVAVCQEKRVDVGQPSVANWLPWLSAVCKARTARRTFGSD